MRRLSSERGAAIVTAMLVMTMMGAGAIVALWAVDAYQRGTGDGRVREAAFQIAEAALGAQVVPIASTWPAAAGSGLPVSCTSTAAPAGCPDPGTIASAFAGTEAAAGTWRVEVRDDVGAGAQRYDRTALQTTPCASSTVAPCTWDSNANGRLWIRSWGTARGRQRSVVALVRRQPVRVPLPRATAIAGRFEITNNGNKVLVDERGCSAKIATPTPGCAANQPAPILVRCTTAAPAPGDPCVSMREGQVSPSVTAQQQGDVVSPDVLSAMREAARAASSLYTTCPTPEQLAAPLVFVEGVNCAYTGSPVINSETQPGRLVIHRGTLELGGSVRYYGLILATNGLAAPADAGTLVTIQGNATVQGAIYVEGAGGLSLGSSGLNLNYDGRSLGDIMSWGLPAFEHHSFRELTPSE